MTMKSMAMVAGAGMLALTIGCAREMPLAPSRVAAETSVSGPEALTTGSTPTVTLLPDLTVDPGRVTVREGYKIKMVNKSGRYAVIQSSNCSEFNMLNVANGGFQYSSVFRPAGKTCDYYAWETDWSRKFFIGQVVVE